MKKKLKALKEKRNALMDQMDALLAACGEGEEQRAFTEEESTQFTEAETEIRALDNTIAAIESREQLENMEHQEPDTEQRALDDKNFLGYIRGETRALDVANNGGIIPQTIADRIIEQVRELSPIYSLVTVYNVGGDLVFPTYDETSSSISAAFMEDMQELTEGTGKFTTVTLENYIVGTLALISRSLMNRTDFDLASYIVYRVAKTISEFLEEKLIQGTAGKNDGVLNAAQSVSLTSATAITADDLIDLQMSVVQQYQVGACWIMHKKTLNIVRKLKDSTGEYLLNKDITTPFGWSILGKPVYITESMPQIAAGAKPVAYGDMSGLYVKFAQNMEIQVLMEKYATRHAVGVVGYVEFDSKIVEQQKISLLKMGS